MVRISHFMDISNMTRCYLNDYFESFNLSFDFIIIIIIISVLVELIYKSVNLFVYNVFFSRNVVNVGDNKAGKYVIEWIWGLLENTMKRFVFVLLILSFILTKHPNHLSYFPLLRCFMPFCIVF